MRILRPTQPQNRLGVVSFDVAVSTRDVGQVLDAKGIARYASVTIAQPIHAHFGVHASSRASFGPYNTPERNRRVPQRTLAGTLVLWTQK